MNGNLIFSLKPKPPLPLNPGGGLERVSLFYNRFFLGRKGYGQFLRTLPALFSKQTRLTRGMGKVAGAVQSAEASS